MSTYPFLLLLHVTGVVIWVGGMLFAHQCLRPPAARLLDPPLRLRLWRAVLGRFFVWVWLSVIAVLASGFAILIPVGLPASPRSWHLMMSLGTLMVAVFLYAVVGPYAALVRAVDAEDWTAGSAALARIRRAVGTNLHLGLLTIAIATLGRLYY